MMPFSTHTFSKGQTWKGSLGLSLRVYVAGYNDLFFKYIISRLGPQWTQPITKNAFRIFFQPDWLIDDGY